METPRDMSKGGLSRGGLSFLQFCLQIIENRHLLGLLFPCGPSAGLGASPCPQERESPAVQCAKGLEGRLLTQQGPSDIA